MKLSYELKHIFDGKIVDSPGMLDQYSRDASICEVMPQAIVFPKDASDIEALVQFVSKKKDEDPNVSLTARAGGTDMSGGPLNESIIVDTTQYLSGIIGFDGNNVRLKPGTFYRDLEREALKKGLMLPSYPASKKLCTVGGMVLNNTAGEKTLSYGPTKSYIEEIKMVCSDSKEYVFKPISLPEAKKKSERNDFEGNLYKQLINLYEGNRDLIQKERPHTSKNASGYYIWDLSLDNIFDITQIIAGSQGTLGIVTELVLSLVPIKSKKRMVMMSIRDLSLIPQLVQVVLPYEPSSLESYDNDTLELAVKYFPDLVSEMGFLKKIQMTSAFIPEFLMHIGHNFPKLVMLVEFEGDLDGELGRKIYGLIAQLEALGIYAKEVSSKIQEEKFWTIRRESYNLLRKHSQGKDVVSFIEDVVVPPEKLVDFIPRIHEILHSYDLVYSIAGHAGSGNFHIFPLMDTTDPNFGDKIIEISDKVYSLVASCGGSITAEHNDGISRTPFMDKIFSKEMLNIFKQIKGIFDPKNIFNPGKKVSVTKDYFKNHLRKKVVNYSM